MSILCLTPRRTQPSFALQIQLFHPIQASRLLFGGDKSSKMLGGDKSSKGWRRGRREKTFLGEKSFFSPPGIQRSRLGKVVLLETRVCISSWEREATTTSMANSYRKMSFQQNCCRITACQKKLFNSRKVFSMSLAMETVSEHPPRLTEFS